RVTPAGYSRPQGAGHQRGTRLPLRTAVAVRSALEALRRIQDGSGRVRSAAGPLVRGANRQFSAVEDVMLLWWHLTPEANAEARVELCASGRSRTRRDRA